SGRRTSVVTAAGRIAPTPLGADAATFSIAANQRKGARMRIEDAEVSAWSGLINCAICGAKTKSTTTRTVVHANTGIVAARRYAGIQAVRPRVRVRAMKYTRPVFVPNWAIATTTRKADVAV